MSNSIVELRSIIHLLTPLGLAEGHFLFNDGYDGTEWGCFQMDTGEFWRWPNKVVRLVSSVSNYRHGNSPISMTPRMIAKLAPHVERTQKARENTNVAHDIPSEPDRCPTRITGDLSHRAADVRPAEGSGLPSRQRRGASRVGRHAGGHVPAHPAPVGA